MVQRECVIKPRLLGLTKPGFDPENPRNPWPALLCRVPALFSEHVEVIHTKASDTYPILSSFQASTESCPKPAALNLLSQNEYLYWGDCTQEQGPSFLRPGLVPLNTTSGLFCRTRSELKINLNYISSLPLAPALPLFKTNLGSLDFFSAHPPPPLWHSLLLSL